jgi:hypothetical protein
MPNEIVDLEKCLKQLLDRVGDGDWKKGRFQNESFKIKNIQNAINECQCMTDRIEYHPY